MKIRAENLLLKWCRALALASLLGPSASAESTANLQVVYYYPLYQEGFSQGKNDWADWNYVDGASPNDPLVLVKRFGPDQNPVRIVSPISDSANMTEVTCVLRLTKTTYQREQTVPPHELERMDSVDRKLPKARTSYVVYSDADGSPRFVLRMFDGSSQPSVLFHDEHPGKEILIPEDIAEDPRMPCQYAHPDFQPDMTRPHYEAGKAAKDPLVVDHLATIFRRAGWAALRSRNPYKDENYGKWDADIYAEVKYAEMLKNVERYGFTVVAGTQIPELPESILNRDYFKKTDGDLVSIRYLPPVIAPPEKFQLLAEQPGQGPRYIIKVSTQILTQTTSWGTASQPPQIKRP